MSRKRSSDTVYDEPPTKKQRDTIEYLLDPGPLTLIDINKAVEAFADAIRAARFEYEKEIHKQTEPTEQVWVEKARNGLIKILYQSYNYHHSYLIAAIDEITGAIYKPTSSLSKTCNKKTCGPARGNVFGSDNGARCINGLQLIRQKQRKCPVCNTSTKGYLKGHTFYGNCKSCNKEFSDNRR